MIFVESSTDINASDAAEPPPQTLQDDAASSKSKPGGIFDKLLFGFVRAPHRSAPENVKRRSGISACFEEGVYAQIWITLTGGKFLTDMALYLGAAAIHLGLISAIPFLASSAQLLGARMVEHTRSRKKVVVPTAFVAREIWWIVILVLLLPISKPVKMWIFVGLYAISHFSGQLAGSAWLSWLSDLVPERMRGRVISMRNGLLIIIALGVDFLLSQMRESLGVPRREMAILIIFTVGAIFGAKSILAFKNQWEPPLPSTRKIPSLKDVFRESFRQAPIRRFARSLAMWNTALGIATSFWVPHMMTYLQMSFPQIFVYTCIVTISNFIMSRFIWGPLIDRVGTMSVVRFTSSLITFIPVFWFIATPERLGFIWAEAVVNGILWSGFNVAIFNLPFSILPEENRTHYFAVLSTIGGFALGCGALLGGVIAQALSSMQVTVFGITYINYHVTFGLSLVMRAATVFQLRKIPDSRYRGMIYMFQAMGDGLVKNFANPRLMMFARRTPAQVARKRRIEEQQQGAT